MARKNAMAGAAAIRQMTRGKMMGTPQGKKWHSTLESDLRNMSSPTRNKSAGVLDASYRFEESQYNKGRRRTGRK
jgi:hypothetical protein